MNDRFWLSFHKSAHCRRANADDLDGAVQDCLNAAAGAGMTCNLIDKDLNVLGHTTARSGEAVFWHQDGRVERQKATA